MRIISQQQVHTNDTIDKTYLLMRIISQQVHRYIQNISLNEISIDKTYLLMRIISQQQVHTNDTIDKTYLLIQMIQ